MKPEQLNYNETIDCNIQSKKNSDKDIDIQVQKLFKA
jgi:hypothetical protein